MSDNGSLGRLSGRLSTAVAGPDSRSGNLVGEDVGGVLAVDVDHDTGVAHGVTARELDGGRAWGSLASTAGQGKVSA